MSDPPVLFTHIPKTAGGSFVEAAVKPNHADDEIYRVTGGLSGAFRTCRTDAFQEAQFIYGHVPYGLHWLRGDSAQYVTFLRHPVDRAISWYYWIKDLDRIDLYRRHPLRNYADSVSIKEFYEDRDHSNMQTRFLAGPFWKTLYAKANSVRLDRWMLDVAKRHLRQYACIGLVEQFETSIRLMQRRFGWTDLGSASRQHTTSGRPGLEELRAFDKRIVDELAEYHQLDFKLYEYAKKLFEQQVTETEPTPNSDRSPATR
jgi:hypothetical protein